MKLQVFILAIGVALSAGAVGAELHRAANLATVSGVVGNPIAASQSALQQPLTTSSQITLSGVRPTIKGGSGDD